VSTTNIFGDFMSLLEIFFEYGLIFKKGLSPQEY
jgi:hypothetical protein